MTRPRAFRDCVRSTRESNMEREFRSVFSRSRQRTRHNEASVIAKSRLRSNCAHLRTISLEARSALGSESLGRNDLSSRNRACITRAARRRNHRNKSSESFITAGVGLPMEDRALTNVSTGSTSFLLPCVPRARFRETKAVTP